MATVLWLTGMLVMTLDVLLGVLFVRTSTDFCGGVFETQVGHALVGHVMLTAVVGDEFECHGKCLQNNSCKSFNIHPAADITKRICELNNKTRKMKPGDFKRKKGSTYHGSIQATCVDIADDKKKRTSKEKRRDNPKRGWYSHHPAHSCKDIRDSRNSRGDGKYWIDPENKGNPLKVFCDMTTDGGGWLLVSNIVLRSATPPFQIPVNATYRGISSDQMVLNKTAMTELITLLSFTQLRFHCHKKKHGRTFHVTTAVNSSGKAVVQYFSGQTNVQPDSCGSFIKMENDNSQLAKVCETWGKENGTYNVGKWGHDQAEDRLYIYPAFKHISYHWDTGSHAVFLCDDSTGTNNTIGDFWKVYIR